MANRIIDGKYEILKELGKGGMSQVYLATDLTLDKLWAIKQIDKTSEEYKCTVNKEQVASEIKIMKDLSHPLLPRIVEAIDTEDYLYIVMDYIEGKTLKKVLEVSGKIDEDIVAGWMIDICNIFTYLHNQNPPIIYRDLKPANIMLKPDGTIRLIDFGIARELKRDIGDTRCLGTEGYASPEHFIGKTTERSDIFTIGTTMYHLITGHDPTQPPYEIRPIREIDRNLSSGLETIIEKCIQANPEKRYSSTEELKEDLENYKKLEIPYMNELKRKLKMFKGLLIVGLACILIGSGLVIGNIVMNNSQYHTLVSNQSPKEEERIGNLIKAINIKPEKTDAYMYLIEEYIKDGFTEDEASEFLAIYNKNREKIRKDEEAYKKLNYQLGESILVYFTGESDNSVRNKLLTAEPFFEAAASDDNEEGILAKGYDNMAEFYKEFIIGNNELIAEDKSVQSYREAIETCKNMLKHLKPTSDSHKQTHLNLTSYELILYMIDEDKKSFAKNDINMSELITIIDDIKGKAQSTEECCELGEQKKKRVLEECNSLEERIKVTYHNERKLEGEKKR